MTQINQNPLLSTRAYPLFISEIRLGLGDFETALNSNALQGQESRRTFAIMFHKIKGSSGFFGFQEIYTLAGMLEDLLNKEDFKKNHDCGDLQSFFDQLKQEVANLPQP